MDDVPSHDTDFVIGPSGLLGVEDCETGAKVNK